MITRNTDALFHKDKMVTLPLGRIQSNAVGLIKQKYAEQLPKGRGNFPLCRVSKWKWEMKIIFCSLLLPLARSHFSFGRCRRCPAKKKQQLTVEEEVRLRPLLSFVSRVVWRLCYATRLEIGRKCKLRAIKLKKESCCHDPLLAQMFVCFSLVIFIPIFS